MTDFAFHRPPREVQRRDFERFKDAPHFALWWDPRVGKTEEVYNIFRYRHQRGDLDALVVLSYPSGVKHVWAEEAAKALPPDFYAQTKVIVWQSGKSVRGERREEILAARDHPGPVVLSFNAEAVNVKQAKDYIEWFIRKRRVMLVLDEASFAARWSGRTKKVLALGDWWVGKRRSKEAKSLDPSAFVKRQNVIVKAILDGSPVDETPFDIFYPSEFLRTGLLGFGTVSAMRAKYCEFEMEEVEVNGVKQLVHAGTKFNKDKAARGDPDPYDRYPVFVKYRDLDDLRVRMAKFGSRVRREDVSDAPPKVYQSAFFELTVKQRRVYDRLRDEYIAELSVDVPVAQVLKRMTRLQMVARNYYPSERTSAPCGACDGLAYLDDGTECEACHGIGYRISMTDLERIDDRNPAAEALVDAARSVGGPFVVWCRFRQDAWDAVHALQGATDDPDGVWLYSGDVPERLREERYQLFKGGTGHCMVATEASGLGRGKDLSRAVATIFYSNEFSLRTRRQTEDRTETVTRTFSTSVIDLVAAGTRDLDVIEALRNKRDVAAEIVGDPRPIRWI